MLRVPVTAYKEAGCCFFDAEFFKMSYQSMKTMTGALWMNGFEIGCRAEWVTSSRTRMATPPLRSFAGFCAVKTSTSFNLFVTPHAFQKAILKVLPFWLTLWVEIVCTGLTFWFDRPFGTGLNIKGIIGGGQGHVQRV
ncbi:uncharacterized protein LOC113566849 isoform X2 [Drosophila persimilis]|nr:uncharacterized protein LOC113566849 isoform X2 [Drosophila persimilis]